jgi:hypothetical protein
MEGLRVETRKVGVGNFDVWVTSAKSRARRDEGIFCACEDMPKACAEVYVRAFELLLATKEGQALMAEYDEALAVETIFIPHKDFAVKEGQRQ